VKKKQKYALVPVACMMAAAAHAQNPETGDTLQFRVAAGVERDSNVLRAPNKVSDEIGTLGVGARYDKQISLQRIIIDAEARTHKHRDRSELDFSTLNYNAAWNFAITPRFRGIASATREQYRDITNATTGVNDSAVRSERVERLEGTYTTGEGWLGQAGLSNRQSRSDSDRALEASPSVLSTYVGVGREFRAGTQLIGRYRQGKGEYDRVSGAGRDFDENELSLIGRYPLSTRTAVEGRIGRLKREHDGAPQRDFSGSIASITADWGITFKTSLQAGLARDIGSYESGAGGAITGNRFFIQPVWRATEKIAVRLRYQRDQREWDVAAGSPDVGRQDTLHFSSVSVDWEPRRNLVVTSGLRGERRNSNVDLYDFSATIFQVGARFTF
jgi:exopolysaccharide biosynthesis operon protein EpsL